MIRFAALGYLLLFFACTAETSEAAGPTCPEEYVTYTELAPALATPADVGELLIPEAGLDAWPDSMARMECLRSLDVTGNQLGNLPPYATTTWRQLGKLKIDDNGLTALPEDAGNWTYFNVGFFNDNQLSALPESIVNWEQAIQLKLNGNRFTEFPPPLLRLEKLNRLSLNDNQLTTLPTDWKGMKNLEYLELKNNQLTDLPTELVNLPNIRAIYVQGNPIDKATQKQIERRFIGVARVVF